MADEHGDEVPRSDPALADDAHDQVGAVLDGIEADLDEVAATVARMG